MQPKKGRIHIGSGHNRSFASFCCGPCVATSLLFLTRAACRRALHPQVLAGESLIAGGDDDDEALGDQRMTSGTGLISGRKRMIRSAVFGRGRRVGRASKACRVGSIGRFGLLVQSPFSCSPAPAPPRPVCRLVPAQCAHPRSLPLCVLYFNCSHSLAHRSPHSWPPPARPHTPKLSSSPSGRISPPTAPTSALLQSSCPTSSAHRSATRSCSTVRAIFLLRRLRFCLSLPIVTQGTRELRFFPRPASTERLTRKRQTA